MAESEVLLKAHTLTVAAPGGETSQPKEDYLRTPSDCLEPPVAMESLRALTQTSDVRESCIDCIANNTVGLGYSLDVEVGHERKDVDITDDVRNAIAMLESLAHRDRRLVPNGASLTDILKAAKWDEEEVGWGFVEVSRDRRNGKISGLFHVPSWRMRRLQSLDGYKLLDQSGSEAGDTQVFYNYGSKVQYDGKGLPTGSLQKGRSWTTNEVIVFKLYTSESRDYGLPRDLAMALEYAADKLATESNVSFFDSSGTPPTVIFVQGEEAKDGSRTTFKVPRSTAEAIADTIKSGKGHQHRVAIIPVPPGTETKDIKLGEISDRDVGFTAFRQDNARRTVSAFRLQPVFIPAVADQGRYTAEIQRAITLEQLFDPEQTRYEDILGECLLRELGYGNLRLAFKRLAIEDDKTRRDSAQAMGEAQVITRREFRAAHGLGPLPEMAKGATESEEGKVPFGWNDEIVEIKKPEGAENRNLTGDDRGLSDGKAGRPDSERHGDQLAERRGRTTSGPAD